MNYLHKLLSNQQTLADAKKNALENIRLYLKEKGNLTGLDEVEEHQCYTAIYINNNGEAVCAYYSQLEISDDNRLYIGLSDGHWLFQEDITLSNIDDLINILQEGHGTYSKQPEE